MLGTRFSWMPVGVKQQATRIVCQPVSCLCCLSVGQQSRLQCYAWSMNVIHCNANRAQTMSHHMQLVLLGVFLLLIAPFETDSFSYENLPAVAMDYKVHIDAGKEDCYSQYVNPGATFYVSFQVYTDWPIKYPSSKIATDRLAEKTRSEVETRFTWLTIWLRHEWTTKCFASRESATWTRRHVFSVWQSVHVDPREIFNHPWERDDPALWHVFAWF